MSIDQLKWRILEKSVNGFGLKELHEKLRLPDDEFEEWLKHIVLLHRVKNALMVIMLWWKGLNLIDLNGYVAEESFGTESNAKKELLFKILVIGDVGTGKSSIIRRYVNNVFDQHYKLTIGVDFATKVLQWDADRLIRLQFWDISGQERFGNMTRVYYKDAHGALVVCDCARRATFNGALRWKNDLDNKVCLSNGKSVPAILIGNKCDLEMNLTDEELAETTRKAGFVGGFKVSAKSGFLIDESIQFLTEQMLETERNGQYGVPIYARDRNIHRLSSEDDTRRRKKDYIFNCC